SLQRISHPGKAPPCPSTRTPTTSRTIPRTGRSSRTIPVSESSRSTRPACAALWPPRRIRCGMTSPPRNVCAAWRARIRPGPGGPTPNSSSPVSLRSEAPPPPFSGGAVVRRTWETGALGSPTGGNACPYSEARTALKDLTGRADADFRAGQFDAISALVEQQRRVLVVQRTGWGKSAVYFLSALLQRRRGAGPALIISPLIALMRDQVAAARRAGVRAEAI